MENIKLKEWISPFTTLNDFFRALVVISKFNSHKIDISKKLSIVLNQRIDKTSLGFFISRVKSHPDVYALDFWANAKKIELQIDELLALKNS